MNEDKSRVLIRYLIDRLSGSIGRTRLVKLAYLADLEAWRHLGRPISDFEYIRFHHGPFDQKILEIKDELRNAGVIAESGVRYGDGKRLYVYDSLKQVSSYPFSSAEEAVLSYVIEEYAHTDLRDLLDDVVYETEPWKAVEEKAPRTRLPMEMVENQARRDLGGVSLERVLRSKEEVADGKVSAWEGTRRELLHSDSEEC